jgi:tetratricopeptide (TPR) repeat protein
MSAMFEFDEYTDEAPPSYEAVATALANDDISKATELAEAALSKKRESASCLAAGAARLAAGETVRAKALADEAISLAKGMMSTDKKSAAAALHLLAKVLLKDNLLRDADAKAGEALQVYADAKSEVGKAAVTATLAKCKRDDSEAATTADEALAMFDKLGNKQGKISVLYIKVTQKLSSGAVDQAILLLDEMERLFADLKKQAGVAAVWLLAAQIHSMVGNIQDAVFKAKEAARILGEIGDSKKKSNAVNVMANILRGAGKFKDAHKAASASYNLCYEMGDKKGQADALCMTATIYDAQNNFGKAGYTLERAAKIYKRLKDAKEEARTLESVASMQMKVIQMLDDPSEPEKLCRKAMALYKEAGMDQSAESAYVLQTLAFALLAQGKADEAVSEAEASINAFRELGNASGEAAALNKLAQIHWSSKAKDDAIKMATKASKIASDAGDLDEAAWSNELLQSYGVGSKAEAEADAKKFVFTDASGAAIKTMGIYMYSAYGKDYCIFSGATWRGVAERTGGGKSSKSNEYEVIEDDVNDTGISIDVDWQTLGSV